MVPALYTIDVSGLFSTSVDGLFEMPLFPEYGASQVSIALSIGL